jgi:class 3 adenylate cyclase
MLGIKEIDYTNAEGAYAQAMKDEGLRTGTEVARINRIIRLIRLIRVYKMYRHSHAFITYVKDPKYETNEEKLKRKIKGDQEESKVGKKLSDITTRRVLVLIILMLLFVPIFTVNTYKEENEYFAYGLELVEEYADKMSSKTYKLLFQSYIDEHKDIPMPVTNVYVKGSAVDSYNDAGINLDEYRPYEIELVKTENGKVVGVFDFRYTVTLTAALGIVRTLFVCGVLTLGAIFFSRDATFLVIRPIEGMIAKVNRIAKNPLEAAQEEENEALAYERALAKEKKKNKKGKRKRKTKDTDYETVKIEQTIIKIGALLALGFGEAGAKIIADNMGHGGDVDPMVPGNKVVAIFGFCDIRNFTDATEVLQEDVMLFVNEVADIVHGVVDRFSGAANKNIGDAFLLVWKFNSEDVEEDETGQLVTKKNARNAQYADMSVLSFLKIIAEIRKSHKLDRYSHNKQILEKLPNFQVKLGFGLHVGWAIEGAIGSDFKIDASYLSPNVNTASRLEAATKQFGVPFLISGNLRKICTPRTQTNLRVIDIVTVKGSNEPTEMVT